MNAKRRRVYLADGEVLEIRHARKVVLRVAIGRNSVNEKNLMIDLCDRDIGYDWSQSATRYINRALNPWLPS
jgi:hypothetical protein